MSWRAVEAAAGLADNQVIIDQMPQFVKWLTEEDAIVIQRWTEKGVPKLSSHGIVKVILWQVW